MRQSFLTSENWPWRGLYWLSKDLYESDLCNVLEPDARALHDLRNHLEHKYVKVVAPPELPTRPPEPIDPVFVIVGTPTATATQQAILDDGNIRRYELTTDPIQNQPAPFFNADAYWHFMDRLARAGFGASGVSRAISNSTSSPL